MNFNVINPTTTPELLQVIADSQGKNFRFGAGFTDLILEIKRQPESGLSVINLAKIQDKRFTGLEQGSGGMRMGAMVTAARIVASEWIRDQFPVLHESAINLASPQIREVATIGVNICTASPSGDMVCALMALNAECELLNTSGEERKVPIREFFTGVRKTVMQKDEVLCSIRVPGNSEEKHFSGFIKIGTRLSMECSVVSLAWHIQTTIEKTIVSAGIAFGSAAPTVVYPKSACEFLHGKKYGQISETEKNEFAQKVLSCASPISDIRGSAWYRKEVLQNICKTILG